jgi:septum formation protein
MCLRSRDEASHVSAPRMKPHVLLGSSSKWRRAILADALGPAVALSQLPPDIDERRIAHPDPAALVVMIAEAKLARVMELLAAAAAAGGASTPDYVLTSDQVAVHNGEVRHKPADAAENVRFLLDYSGGCVSTVAGWAVLRAADGAVLTGTHSTTTHFSEITAAAAGRIVARGDSLGCCGGFVVEDVDLNACIVRIDGGTLQSVQGVDVPFVTGLLKRQGL